jgi:predicted PurR-regulated permease PerM
MGDPAVLDPSVPRFKSLKLPSAPFWVLLIGGILGAIVLVLSASALIVFAIGTALSFFLVPLVNWLHARGMPRVAAAILVVAVLVVVTVVLLLVAAFIVVEQGVAFVEGFPEFMAEIEAGLKSLDLPDWVVSTLTTIGSALDAAVSALDPATLVIGFIQGLLGMLGLLFSFLLLPFFLFYLLKDQPRMSASFYRNVPLPWKADVDRILTIMSGNFAQYFKAELLVGGIMFVIVSVGMFVIGSFVPNAEILVTFALLLGLIAFVMELLPQIGPILSYIPALILALTAGPEAVIAVSIFYFIVFNIEGSVLVPTFEGKMISFSGATVLVLITMGFAIAGMLGAIVALPVAAIARDLFNLFFRRAQVLAGVAPPPRLDQEPLADPVVSPSAGVSGSEPAPTG